MVYVKKNIFQRIDKCHFCRHCHDLFTFRQMFNCEEADALGCRALRACHLLSQSLLKFIFVQFFVEPGSRDAENVCRIEFVAA